MRKHTTWLFVAVVLAVALYFWYKSGATFPADLFGSLSYPTQGPTLAQLTGTQGTL